VCDDEPFLDLDGDGRYDPGEPFVDANRDGKRTREAFTDTNGDGDKHRNAVTDAYVHARRRYAWSVDTGSACSH
jgi:hypothetical protein